MKRPLILATCAILTGCGTDRESVLSGPPLTEPPGNPATKTYVVSGLVRDETGAPLNGVTAEIASPTARAIAITNATGAFSFRDVRGFASVHVWMERYEVYEHYFGVL